MKIYNVVKIPQGLGYDQFDYEEVWQSGYTAGYESGYTDGQNDCPEPKKELWIEDLSGNVLTSEVVTLPTTGGDYTFKVICTDETIVWNFTEQLANPWGDYTGSTTITKTLPARVVPGDFYTWSTLYTKTADATVVPGSAIRFTYDGLEPALSLYYDKRSGSATTSGYVYYNTAETIGDLTIISNTGWTLDYVEEITGIKDAIFPIYPVSVMGGHISKTLRFPAHDGPRRYVITAYYTDTMEPVKNIVIEQIMEE